MRREGPGQGGGAPLSPELQAGMRAVQGGARPQGDRARVAPAPGLSLGCFPGPPVYDLK